MRTSWMPLQHYKDSRLKGCLISCGKAFESTMKIICDLNKWSIPSKATASSLIKTLIDTNFFPSYQQSQLTSLRTLLETTIPTPRNKSAHGSGNTPIHISQSFASFILYSTGATIRLLVETFNGH